MARYQVKLAYDGTNFSGFQKQLDVRTVQAEIEKVLQKLGWAGKSILFAGRTDAGVHANGQVIAFDLDWRHAPMDLLRSLNANLPEDVAVQDVCLTEVDFHPRYSASCRKYQYRLFCTPVRQPLRERYAWRVWPAVDLDLMKAAAVSLLGTHDFAAFGSPLRAGGGTVRTVYRSEWQTDDMDMVYTIEANAFLYHMVRRLVAYQVEIGKGSEDPAEVLERLFSGEKIRLQGLAPAQGLTLLEITYSGIQDQAREH